MSTSNTARLTLSIPEEAQGVKYTIAWSINKLDDDNSAIHLEESRAVELRDTADENQKAVIVDRKSVPRFSSNLEQEVLLKAHFWKGNKLLGNVDVGNV